MQFTTPEELAELAVFFCSSAANNVRGVAWNMDGGWMVQVRTCPEIIWCHVGAQIDEFEVLARRMGWLPMQAARARNRPISPQPGKGSALFGRSAALRCLPIAGLWAAHRVLHPIPKRALRGTK